MRAIGCVFDGYQLLSMIGYGPQTAPWCTFFFSFSFSFHKRAFVRVCRRENAFWGGIDILVSVGLGGDWSGWSPLPLFLKQMHLQLALSEEREGKHAAGVEICFGSSALMALDLCRWL